MKLTGWFWGTLSVFILICFLVVGLAVWNQIDQKKATHEKEAERVALGGRKGCLSSGSVNVLFSSRLTVEEIRNLVLGEGLNGKYVETLEQYATKPGYGTFSFNASSQLTREQKHQIVLKLNQEEGIVECSENEIDKFNRTSCDIQPQLTQKDADKIFAGYPNLNYRGISKWPSIPIVVPEGQEFSWYDKFKSLEGSSVSGVSLGICPIE